MNKVNQFVRNKGEGVKNLFVSGEQKIISSIASAGNIVKKYITKNKMGETT